MKTHFLLAALLVGACSNSVPADGADARAPADGTDAGVPADGTDAGRRDTPDAPSLDSPDARREPDAGPPPVTPDAGPPVPMAACDELPATVPSQPVDVYYGAVQLCGLPGGECVVRGAPRPPECAGGANVLVGYDFTDAGQVRVQNDWTIASATAGMPVSSQSQHSIPTDAEASVVLVAPDGARYALTFVIGMREVRIVSFTAVAP
jgi:hypothetical protein